MKKLLYGLVAFAGLCASAAIAAEETAADRLRVLYTAQSSYQEPEIGLIANTFSQLTGVEVDIDYIAYAEQYQRLQDSIAEYDIVFARSGLVDGSGDQKSPCVFK